MNKNHLVLVTIIAILLSAGLFMHFKNAYPAPSAGLLETYVGGVCKAPVESLHGRKPQVVNLYKSKGQSIQSIKGANSRADCALQQPPIEYRLYP